MQVAVYFTVTFTTELKTGLFVRRLLCSLLVWWAAVTDVSGWEVLVVANVKLVGKLAQHVEGSCLCRGESKLFL